MNRAPPPLAALSDAALVSLAVAVDPQGLGGVVIHGMPTMERDRWLALMRGVLSDGTPWRKIPARIDQDALLGGLDIAATLKRGSPVLTKGVLPEADGGVLLLAMAERLSEQAAALISATLDQGFVLLERDGFTRRLPAEVAVVALDESVDGEEPLSPSISDRLAFRLCLADLCELDLEPGSGTRSWLAQARRRYADVAVSDSVFTAMGNTASVLGVSSIRGDLMAIRAARVFAALSGLEKVSDDIAALSARLVLAWRAERVPAPEQEQPPEESPPEPERSKQDSKEDQKPSDNATDQLEDVVLEATRAAIPADLLRQLAAGSERGRNQSSGGRGGAQSHSKMRGRSVGSRPARTLGNERINLLATLKAAAPWQRLRRSDDDKHRIQVRRDDLRVTRYKDHVESTTLFVVDASGSQAAQRLGEVKGAVELLLADCYVNRDQVAMIVFRGDQAEMALPPTRALARARSLLASIPGGGGTPLAAGIEAAQQAADQIQRQGRQPKVVFLTDGRGNISRDGAQGHRQAQADARMAAHAFRSSGFSSILIDTSARPRRYGQDLADDLAAKYVPLPRADANALNSVIREVAA